MADLLRQYSTSKIETKDMGELTDNLMTVAKESRKSFVRRWYDNNFFDDGFHFRYMSRQQNKVVDLSARSNLYQPMRAIPKASRQIRGIANLLLSSDPTPIIYPEKVNKMAYPSVQGVDPTTGQPAMQENPEYKQAVEEAKRVAQLTGHWMEEEFKKQDMLAKLAHMVLLTQKHGVSFVQVWPDYVKEEICTQVYDAFDIYLIGSLTDIYDSPFMMKASPEFITKIQANEYFDEDQRQKLNPDNKQSSDEIKEAYMRARFGRENSNDQAATIMLKECYMKEYLTSDNMSRIRQQENGGEILKNKKEGDIVIRQVFEAGRVWLRDEYLNIPDYPFIDFRMEPGPIYQVPMIERFIPANKSLDMLLSRAERYSHLMTTGSWSVKKGETAEPTNTAGGQVFEYATTPPVQNQIASIPAFYFELMNMMTSLIEEQGVTTTTLGKIPAGVKAARAIESLKESEYANLVIAARRLKGSVKKIAEKMLDIADSSFVRPQTVYFLEKGEPQYFDVIGNRAYNLRQELGVDEQPLDAVPLKKEYRVEIEVQNGLGYTREGQKDSANELAQFMLQLATAGFLPPEAMITFLESLLDTYQFGPTQDVMQAAREGGIPDTMMDKVKTGMLEVIKDAADAGIFPTSEQRIDEAKVANLETAKDVRGGGQDEGK